MPLNWKQDIREQSANALLLLDGCQLAWLAQNEPSRKFGLLLRENPHIAWFISHKMPELAPWVEKNLRMAESEPLLSDADRAAIVGDVMQFMEDWIVYVLAPEEYHCQPFVGWDERELTQLTDYSGKTVVDIGSGTGKQAFALAPLAKTVFCVEPVWNLRRYLKRRAETEGFRNVYVVDGVVESIPFPDGFADIVTSGHVVGDDVPRETAEMERITKSGGMVILCPGNNDVDNGIHQQLTAFGYASSSFLEPGDGYKRKYWKTV